MFHFFKFLLHSYDYQPILDPSIILVPIRTPKIKHHWPRLVLGWVIIWEIKIIGAFAWMILTIFLCFDRQFLSSHASYKQHKALRSLFNIHLFHETALIKSFDIKFLKCQSNFAADCIFTVGFFYETMFQTTSRLYWAL